MADTGCKITPGPASIMESYLENKNASFFSVFKIAPLPWETLFPVGDKISLLKSGQKGVNLKADVVISLQP